MKSLNSYIHMKVITKAERINILYTFTKWNLNKYSIIEKKKNVFFIPWLNAELFLFLFVKKYIIFFFYVSIDIKLIKKIILKVNF